MKRLNIIKPFAALAIFCLLQACIKKETPSRIVEIGYPTVTLVGSADTTISRGATWVDPGATWTDSITGETGTIKLSVNTSVDSAYVLVYRATDKDGFSSSVTRGLAVTNINSSADISGAYTNSYTGAPANLTKVSRGLFAVDDIDGLGDPGVIAIKSDSTISVATIQQNVTAPGANLSETFTQASIVYQAPFYYTGTPPHITAQPAVIMQWNETLLNVPPIAAGLVKNLQ